MTLTDYDPKLLNFLYELTKLNAPLSSDEIANRITLENNQTISPRTVRNWFYYLREPYCYLNKKIDRKFTYFPTFYREKMGLRVFFIFYYNPSEKLVGLIPYQEYCVWLFDSFTRKHILFITYAIPQENTPDFYFLLEKLKQTELCSSYKIFETNTSHRIYSPWHKVIDKNGQFHPKNNDLSELKKQVTPIHNWLKEGIEVEMVNKIKNNPLFLPILVECYFEYWSSIKIWKTMKNKLGADIWHYLKNRRRKTDGVGIKKVQQLIKLIPSLNIFNEMRVTYLPIEFNQNFFIYCVVNLKNNDLISTLLTISINSVYVSVYPCKKELFLILLVNKESLQEIFEVFQDITVKELLFLRHFKSLNYLLQRRYFKLDYYKLYDPQRNTWIFNVDNVLNSLFELVK